MADQISAADLDTRFADNMWTTRTRLRLSRRELAERTGLTARVIEKIESGATCRAGVRRRVSIGEAVVIAHALGMKPGDLIRGQAVAHV